MQGHASPGHQRSASGVGGLGPARLLSDTTKERLLASQRRPAQPMPGYPNLNRAVRRLSRSGADRAASGGGLGRYIKSN